MGSVGGGGELSSSSPETVFRGFRLTRQVLRLSDHLQRIETSLSMRRRYQTEGRRGMVLATNYELVSDATRALDSLRRIEELTPDHEIDLEARTEYGNLRKRLLEHTTLPAIPAWRVTGRSADSGRATQAEIEELYRQFLELGEG